MGKALKNGRRELFCREYIIDNNATQAAIRAGYSKRSAYAQGNRLLKSDEIQARISNLRQDRVKRLEIQADDVVRRLVEKAFVNLGDYFEIQDDGTVTLDLTKAKAGDAPTHIFRKIRQKEVLVGSENDGYPLRQTEFEVDDSLRAIDMLMRHLGLYAPDKMARTNAAGQDVSDGNTDVDMLIAALRRRQSAGGDK